MQLTAVPVEAVETVKSLNAFTQSLDVRHPNGEKFLMLLKFTVWPVIDHCALKKIGFNWLR